MCIAVCSPMWCKSWASVLVQWQCKFVASELVQVQLCKGVSQVLNGGSAASPKIMIPEKQIRRPRVSTFERCLLTLRGEEASEGLRPLQQKGFTADILGSYTLDSRFLGRVCRALVRVIALPFAYPRLNLALPQRGRLLTHRTRSWSREVQLASASVCDE